MGRVDLGFPVEEVREGAARLLVPRGYTDRGPGSRSRLPFYNPVMAVARDLTVLLLRAVGRERPVPRLIDGMAATGALGIRAALEGRVVEIILNDRNPAAVNLIRENLKLNGLEARVEVRDIRALLVEVVSSWVEVDPYGTPVPFLDAALQGIHNGGILGVTATDTAVLTGAYPVTCLRRYDARPLRSPFSKEVALRILLASLVRWAARYDLGTEVLLAYSTEHFLRAHVRVRRGGRRAEEALGKLAYVLWDPATGHRSIIPEAPRQGSWGGPLWGAALGDRRFLGRMPSPEGLDGRTPALLALLREEVDLPPLFYNTDELARLLGTAPPPRAKLIQALQDQNIPTARTHFDPKGIRTAGSSADVLAAVEALGKLHGGQSA